jgi:hypothetical protein
LALASAYGQFRAQRRQSASETATSTMAPERAGD